MEMETEDCKWYEYKCKFGETLFFYNTVTGERRLPNQRNCSVDDIESNSCETEEHDPSLYQQNRFVHSIGTQTEDTTAVEDVGSQTDAPKTYNSTGTETDITGVSDSRRLQALFNCALSVCSTEKVCRGESVKVTSVAQTKGGYGGSCDICVVHQLEMQPNQLDKAINEERNMSALKEQRPMSHNATPNVDKEDSGEIVKKGLVDGQQMHLEKEITVKGPQILLDGHHDTHNLEILPCESDMSSGGAAGKKKSSDDLIESNRPEVVVPHCLEDDLETHSSEKVVNRGRQRESSGVTTICNSIQVKSSNEMSTKFESIIQCLGSNVTTGQLHTFIDLEEKDEIVDHLTLEKVFSHELPDNPPEEVSLEREENEKMINDGNRQDMLISVSGCGKALCHFEDKILGVPGGPRYTDTVQNQEQSTATGVGCWKCTQCEKAFKFRSLLVRHIRRTHRVERPYKCSKAFKTPSKVNSHLRFHTGERPFKCTQCYSSFTCRSHLSIHLRIHTGERPYKCTQCDKAFACRSNLSVHLGLHTGERPYKCTQCYKEFKSKSNLNGHLQTHTRKRSFIECTQCSNKVFNTRSELNSHLRTQTRKVV